MIICLINGPFCLKKTYHNRLIFIRRIDVGTNVVIVHAANPMILAFHNFPASKGEVA